MTSPSYATAAATTDMNGPQQRLSFMSDLYMPQPTSMTLVAALLLLEPPTKSVYLMSKPCLQNWLRWAYHQPVAPGEMDRVKQALKLAANAHQLDITVVEYTDPSPVDNGDLSVPGYPLLLRPEIDEVQAPENMQPLLQKAKSFKGDTKGHGHPAEAENGKISCCVVPERFYEVRIPPVSGRYGIYSRVS